jgi:hypothetical protein
MIRALLWKEWRNSVKLLLALGLGAVAAVGIGVVPAASSAVAMTRYWQSMMGGVAFLLPLAAAGLLGANAFAGERAQHAEPFLDPLPVKKLSAALLKVAFSFLLLFTLNAVLWHWVRPKPAFLPEFKRTPSPFLTTLATQMLVFGLCFLSSALSDRPIRSLLRVPFLAFFIAWPVAVSSVALLVLAGVHSPEPGPESLWGAESLFDGAMILAGLLMLGTPFFVERWRPYRGQGLILALMLALSLIVVALPAVQFCRLWGRRGFQQLLDAFDLDKEAWVWATGLGACMIGAALVLEARNWLGRGIGVAWATAASASWVVGGCVLVGWTATVSGLFGQLDAPKVTNTGGLVSSPDGRSLLAVGGKWRAHANGQSVSEFFAGKSRPVFFRIGEKQALRLPAGMTGRGIWSPDGRYVALPYRESVSLVRDRTTCLALLDTQTSVVRFAPFRRGTQIHWMEWNLDSKSLVSLGVDRSEDPELVSKLQGFYRSGLRRIAGEIGPGRRS